MAIGRLHDLIRCVWQRTRSLLVEAARLNFVECCRLLVQKGHSTGVRDKVSRRVIACCIAPDCLDSKNGWTELHHAVATGSILVVRWLKEELKVDDYGSFPGDGNESKRVSACFSMFLESLMDIVSGGVRA